MEIERKYRIDTLPKDYDVFPFHQIEQAYLAVDPVIRIRKEDNSYYLTYKSKGLLIREEYNLPLTPEAYEHLKQKADGQILSKKRYLLPFSLFGTPQSFPDADKLTIELDIFEGSYEGLMLAEVEFREEEDAQAFLPPKWFGRDVTLSGEYQNSRLALLPPFPTKPAP